MQQALADTFVTGDARDPELDCLKTADLAEMDDRGLSICGRKFGGRSRNAIAGPLRLPGIIPSVLERTISSGSCSEPFMQT